MNVLFTLIFFYIVAQVAFTPMRSSLSKLNTRTLHGGKRLIAEQSGRLYSLISQPPSKRAKNVDDARRSGKKHNSQDGDARDAILTSKFLSNQVLSPSPTQLDMYSSDESRGNDSFKGSMSSPLNEEVLHESDSDSQISRTSSPLPSDEPLPPHRTVNGVLKPQTSSPTVHPKNAKLQFYQLLREHQVCNAKHYDTLLTSNSYLRKIEESLNPNLLQTYKRVAFNQNLMFDKPCYVDRIKEFTPLQQLRDRDQSTQLEITLITAFLTTISTVNSTTIDQLCYNLVSVCILV